MTDVYGGFIQPDPRLETVGDPSGALGFGTLSGHKAAGRCLVELAGRNFLFDRIMRKVANLDIEYEDQCSAQYYYDLFRTLRDYAGEYDRVVEVGVYMGGSTSVIAGCMDDFHFGLDLVDVDARYLRFTYERVRRTHGARDVRLFWGDLPSYVKAVLLPEAATRTLVHHDGAHDFNVVIRDLAVLSFVRNKVHALIMQDTNLRGRIRHCNFVDAALYAIFGEGMAYAPIGAVYAESNKRMMDPNPYEGNYFLPGAPEGMVIPLQHNTFRYPHPSMTLDEFILPPRS